MDEQTRTITVPWLVWLSALWFLQLTLFGLGVFVGFVADHC